MSPASTSSFVKLWVRAIRPVAYPASVLPALLGVLIAAADGYPIGIFTAALTIIGVVFAHTGANLASDYFDFRSGIDRRDTLGGSGVLVEGLLSARAIFIASALFFFLALICGSVVYLRSSFNVWPLVLFGFIAGAFYSTPFFGFKRAALGELIVLLAFGVGIAEGAYAVQAGSYSLPCGIMATSIGLYVSAILFSNNLRDMQDDRAMRIRTLAVLLGKGGGLFAFALMIFLPFLVVFKMAMLDLVTWWAMLCLAALPLAIRLYLRMKRALLSGPQDVAPLLEQTAKLCMFFGVFLCAGLIIRILIGG